MIVRCNDDGTKLEIISQSHRDTLDLADILHRMGAGVYEFRFCFPTQDREAPSIELTPLSVTVATVQELIRSGEREAIDTQVADPRS